MIICAVWQILKKLSEGHLDSSKWKEEASSGKGSSGRGGKGDLDRNVSEEVQKSRSKYIKRDGRDVSFLDIYVC